MASWRSGIFLLLLAACSSRAPSPPAAAAPPPAIEVRVDRRVELFQILFRLAGRNECRGPAPTDYERDVENYFANFHEHPAVVATRQLIAAHGIGYNAPMSFAVYLDDQLELTRPLQPPPDGLDERWNDVDAGAYLPLVRAFVKDSGFDAFMSLHRPYYLSVEAKFRELVAKEEVVTWFDGFFGPRRDARYTLVPGLLIGNCNFGARTQGTDGRQDFYQALSLSSSVATLVHETAHSYVNPLVDRHAAELEPGVTRVFQTVEKPMRDQAYPTWKIVAYESLVRASTQLYLRDRQGAEAAARDLRENDEKSFLWIGELADVLARCRGEQRGFEACFPDVASFFVETGATYAAHGPPRRPFLGPINAVLAKPFTLVAPAAAVAPRLRIYVQTIRDRFFAAAPFEDAKAGPLAAAGLVLYGSPRTNPAVATMAQKWGWTIADKQLVIGDKMFKGSGLVLIACRAHPDDPTRGVLVYTAARDDDLVGVNSVFHGPTDWVVARRLPTGKYETLADGRF